MNYKTILFITLNYISINAANNFTSEIGDAGSSKLEKYNVLNRNGEFDKPTSFSNDVIVDGSFSDNIVINGDFEDDKNNWDVVDGDGFVVDTQSQVNHDGQYVWGSSTSGFTIEQIYDMSSHSYPRYIRLYADYSGWDSKDTIQTKISFLDKDDEVTGGTSSSVELTGNKDDEFKNYYQEITIPTNAKKTVIDMQEVRNSGSDSDGYLDNLVIKIRPYKYYMTNNSEHIHIPDYNKTSFYYANGGNDLLEAIDEEVWSERQRYNGGKGNDYIILPVGKLNYANGNAGNDVCIAYQGTTLSTKIRLNGGSGNDKLYAPIKGVNHIIKGYSGIDMVVFLGDKDDYTLTYDNDTEYYKFKNDDVTVYVYKDVEGIAFTNDKVMDLGNTKKSEDIWVFDEDNKLTDVFPTDLQDVLKSVKSTPYQEKITNDIEGNFTLYINNLPNTIAKATDTNGNLIVNAVTETNEDGDTKTYIRIPNLTGGEDLNIIFIDEQNNSEDYVEPNFDNLRLTRGM